MTNRTKAVFYLFLIAAILICGISLPVWSQWSNGGGGTWSQGSTITVVNSGSSLTDYQTKITLTSLNFNYAVTNADGSDIRFADAADTTELSYWIEDWVYGANSDVWVNIPDLPAGTTYIYIHYGNSLASSSTDYDNTFSTMSVTNGLEGLWAFNEGSGMPTDSSGNGFDATTMDATWRGEEGGQWDSREDVRFSNGDSIWFGGAYQDERVLVPDPAGGELDYTGNFSFGYWIYYTSIPANWYADFCKGQDGSVINYLGGTEVSSGRNCLQFMHKPAATWDSIRYDIGVSSGHWNHVIFNVYTTSVSCHYNGQPGNWGNRSLTETLTTSGQALWIGARNWGYGNPKYMDDVRVYNRNLTEDEIQCIYERRKYASVEPAVYIDTVTIDSQGPAAVTTLASIPGQEEITLTWLSPGEDGTSSILTGKYAIQYSSWVNWQDIAWSSANAQVTISTVAVAPGTFQASTIVELDWEATYYFRLWTADDVENWSSISNGTTACVQTPPREVIFEDDFETGDLSAWDGQTVHSTNYVGTTDTVKWAGSYGLVSEDTSTSAHYALVFENVSEPDLYCRFYVYLSTGFYTSFWSGDYRVLASIGEQDTGGGITLRTNEARQLYVLESLNWQGSYSAITPEEETWYCVEIRAPKCRETTRIEWWLDGSAQPVINTNLGNGSRWDQIDVGFALCSSDTVTQTAYYDEVVVANTYTGTMAGGGDSTSPDAVNDLSAATGSNRGEVNVSWSSPGDDGASGDLTGNYRIQHATWTGVNWDSASAQVVIATSGVTPTQLQSYYIDSLTAGVTYYFRIWSEDEVPNIAGISNAATAWAQWDTTPPSDITNVYDGLAADVNVTLSSSSLSANWEPSADAESGIDRYEYAIGTTQGGTETLGWTDIGTSTYVTRTSLTLSIGTTYYFTVKAFNGDGLESNATDSDGQWVDDATPPTDISTVNDGLDVDINVALSTGALSANWTDSEDPESGLDRYEYAIGTTQGGTETLGWTDVGTSTYVTRTGLTLSIGTTYYFTVKSYNTMGDESNAVDSDGQWVDDPTPPTDIGAVNDGLGPDIAIALSTGALSANWTDSEDPESGLDRYEYAIGTTQGGTETLGWTDNGTSTYTTRTGLTLTIGTTYYVTVKSFNTMGDESNAVDSDGQWVDDLTAPTDISTVNDGSGADIDVTFSSMSLSANWSASDDPESGIAKYQYAIGTTQGGTETVGWTDNATTNVNHAGLTLTIDTTYYFTVRAVNGMGDISNATDSDGQWVDEIVDNTPPTVVDWVNDGLGADIDVTASTGTLSANWAAADDPESGILKYQYMIGTTPGGSEILGWTDNATTDVTSTGLTLTIGTTYFVTARAVNGVSMPSTSTFSSDGQWVDDPTPPTDIGTVNDGLDADINIALSTGALSANWTDSEDPESGLDRYEYAIGTTQGGTETLGWTDIGTSTYVTRTGLTLSIGTTYYFTVKAFNAMGDESNTTDSDGQWVDDPTPPTDITTVNDGNGDDIDVVYSSTTLMANWTQSIDPESGILRYDYAIGTTQGAVDVVSWTSAGTSTYTVHSGLTLSVGTTYYFTVKALNSMLDESNTTESDGQWAEDVNPPAKPTLFIPAILSTTTITWSWQDNADNEDGYRIITGTGGLIVELGPLAGTGGTTTYTETGLLPNTSCQRYVQAFNNSGATNSDYQGYYSYANPPSEPLIDAVGADFVNISWNTNLNTSYTRYGISHAEDIGFTINVSTPYYDLLSSTATLGSLSQDTTYWFRIFAINSDSIMTDFSIIVSTETLGLPDAPDGFIGLALSTTAIRWSWNDNSNDEDGFRVYSSTGGDPLYTAAQDALEWTETGLTENTLYTRYVAAYNFGGETQSGTTAYYTLTNEPSGLAVTAITEHTIAMQWTGNGTTYDVEKSTDGVVWSTAPVTNTVLTSFTDTYLLAAATQWYRILAYNGDDILNATPSNVVSTVTLAVEVIIANSSTTVVGVDSDTGQTIRIFISSSTFDNNLYIRISDPQNSAALTSANTKDEADETLDRIAGTEIQIDAIDLWGNVLTYSDFNEDVTITLSYPDAESNGLVDNTSPSLDETTLGIYVLNESLSEWEAVTAGHTADTSLNTVSVTVEHFSIFVIMGEPVELDEIKVYPSPWRTTSGVSTITFGDLPETCEIRIYTAAGDLVRTILEPDDDGGSNDRTYAWDITNESGADIAQGVYIYMILEQGTNRYKVGKLAIIRQE